jgi:hypothetical protein
MRKRFALGLLLGVACSLVGAASASACAIANLWLPDSAGPGDTVPYSISGIEPTASYSFTIAGQTVSGTNTSSNPAVDGTFTMPDLGSQAQTLTAYGQCTCPDGSDQPGLIRSMQYLPPPPPPPPPATTSDPSASVSLAEHSSRSHFRPEPPVAAASHASKNHLPPAGTDVGASAAGSVGSGPSTSQPSSQPSSARHSTGDSSSVPGQILKSLGSMTSVGPAKVPTMSVLMFALIFVAGTSLAAAYIYYSQKGPDPLAAIKAPAPVPDDPVEAELQEMIADGMAQRLLVDLELGEAVNPLRE